MAAKTATPRRGEQTLRQFVVRLWQSKDPKHPELYDRLLEKSLERSRQEGRRVPMTELVREAIERFLSRDDRARPR